MGFIAGAVADYSYQAYQNSQEGMDLGAALTTDIDLWEVAAVGGGAAVGAGIGTVLSPVLFGVGTTAASVACADGDCANEANMLTQGLQADGDPQSLNRYSYVYNNPINATDPTGHCPWCIGAAVGFAVGAIGDYAYQVHLNMTEGGMGFRQALTTDISFKEIAMAGGAGAVTGATFGLASGVAATGAIAGSTAGTLAAGIVSSPHTGVHGIGGTYSFNMDASFIANIEVNVGLEMVWNGNARELTGFGILGGDVSFGPQEGFFSWQKRLWSGGSPSPINTSASLYYANIHNVANAVTDYAGKFDYHTGTISTSHGGFSLGYGGALYDDGWKKLPYAHTIGGSTGWSGTINTGSNYYYPIFSASPHGGSLFPNLGEHIQKTWGLFP